MLYLPGASLQWREHIPGSALHTGIDPVYARPPDSSAVRRFAGVVLLLAGIAGCGGSSTLPTAPTPIQPLGLACGVERWFVKTLADDDASRVNVNVAVPITIRELNGFASHCADLPDRRAFGQEFTVYDVLGTITFVAHEDDRDYHIALEDPNSPGFTVVAELADTLCVGAIVSPHFASLSAADAMWNVLLGDRSPSALVGATVRVRGVGFYDFAHGQRGRSQNCIELHPIIAITQP